MSARHAMTNSHVHGGTDALGVPRWDFSTNRNACGPCPMVQAAIQAADATRYPDPAYTGLRKRLAAFHGVELQRILLAGSASEAIFRLSAWAVRQGARWVHLPPHAYADYARAAKSWGLSSAPDADASDTLVWACEPSSPLGQVHTGWPQGLLANESATLSLGVLDCAYEPLRLSGTASLTKAQQARIWCLFSPNKALGLTGVRAAYLVAPDVMSTKASGSEGVNFDDLEQLAPSWPLGAHGVALLQAWTQPQAQSWLNDSLHSLRRWKVRQIALLNALDWVVQASEANFFCARPPQPIDAVVLRQHHGIKLRDATSFGLPGWFRLGVLPPTAQDALVAALSSVPLTPVPVRCRSGTL